MTASSYPQYQQVDAAGEIVGGAATGTDLADIKDAIDAIVPLIDGLELITGNIRIDSTAVNLNVDQVESLLNATNELLLVLETRTRPLVWTKTYIVDVGDSENPVTFDLSDQVDRRAVRITNNSGDEFGRNAATAFIAYNGNTPAAENFDQVCAPGQSILLDSPQAIIIVTFGGTGATDGTVSIVEYL